MSDREVRKKRLDELRTYLKQRGYPDGIINTGIKQATNIPLESLRSTKTPTNETDVLTFVHTHNPRHPNVSEFIKHCLTDLNSSERMEMVMKDTKNISAKRQAPNLKNLLTRAKFYPDINNGGVTKCKNNRCLLCKDHLIQSTDYTFRPKMINFNIKKPLSCKSENVLYVLECNSCHKQYIGETSCFRSRINLHKSHIKNLPNESLFVSKHIANCAKNLQNKFSCMPFYEMPNGDKEERLIKEQHFINKFKPELNK